MHVLAWLQAKTLRLSSHRQHSKETSKLFVVDTDIGRGASQQVAQVCTEHLFSTSPSQITTLVTVMDNRILV